MLSALRQKFTFVLDRLAIAFHKIGFTPNLSTLLGFIFAVSAGLLLFLKISDFFSFLISPLLVLISGLFDALDGSLARLSGKVSKFGGILDSTFDRLGEVFVLSGIMLGGLSSPLWGLIAISASLMVSYVRARSEVEGLLMSGIGIAERPERILILVATLLLRITEYGVILVGVLSVFTVAQRIFYAYRKLS